jgi:hypothetical protein
MNITIPPEIWWNQPNITTNVINSDTYNANTASGPVSLFNNVTGTITIGTASSTTDIPGTLNTTTIISDTYDAETPGDPVSLFGNVTTGSITIGTSSSTTNIPGTLVVNDIVSDTYNAIIPGDPALLFGNVPGTITIGRTTSTTYITGTLNIIGSLVVSDLVSDIYNAENPGGGPFSLFGNVGGGTITIGTASSTTDIPGDMSITGSLETGSIATDTYNAVTTGVPVSLFGNVTTATITIGTDSSIINIPGDMTIPNSLETGSIATDTYNAVFALEGPFLLFDNVTIGSIITIGTGSSTTTVPGDMLITGSFVSGSFVSDAYNATTPSGPVSLFENVTGSITIGSTTSTSNITSTLVVSGDTSVNNTPLVTIQNLAVSTWTPQTAAEDNVWKSITWSPQLGIFCAVSANGTNRVMNSLDGSTWSPYTATEANSWESVAYSSELGVFAAVSSDGTNRVMTSLDGENWTPRSAAEANSWNSVTWSPQLGIFVAVASSSIGDILGARVATVEAIDLASAPATIDGITMVADDRVLVKNQTQTWTSRTNPNGSIWRGLTWVDDLSLFVGVGQSTSILNSTDGITWTTVTGAGGMSSLDSVAWSPSVPNLTSLVAGSGYTNGTQQATVTGGTGIGMTLQIDVGGSVSEEIDSAIPTANGTGYTVGDVLTIVEGSGTGGEVTVSSFGLFVGVSGQNSFNKGISPTGTSDWTVVSGTGIRQSHAVTWSPKLGLFCEAGQSGAVATSPTGHIWTTRSTPLTTLAGGISWSPELDIFVVLSDADVTNGAMVSSDGINWISYTTPQCTWTDVVWSPELGIFCACADGGTASTQIMTSPNGTIWTGRTHAISSCLSITWSPELGIFIAIKDNSPFYQYSSDGILWNVGTGGPGTGGVGTSGAYYIAWSSKLALFASVGDLIDTATPADNGIYSWNGTSSTMTRTTDAALGTASSGVSVYISDGTINSNRLYFCISPGGSTFGTNSVFSEFSTNQVMTSPDGITWTPRVVAVGTNSWNSITWSPELRIFCAVSQTGTDRVMTSPDGISWTPQTAPEANEWNSVTWSPQLGIFCAVSETGTNRVMTSPDGITWTPRIAAEANQWNSVTWSPQLSLFCAVAISGTNRVMTSPYGITWTTHSAAGTNNWTSITWSPELLLFCAVSSDGTNRVMISDNDFSDYDQSTTIGTQAVSDLLITGKDIDIGRSSNTVTMGEYADITTVSGTNVNIGTIGSSVVITGASSLDGILTINNDSLTIGTQAVTNVSLLGRTVDIGNIGNKLGFYGDTPITQQVVGIDLTEIHTALVNLGLIK